MLLTSKQAAIKRLAWESDPPDEVLLPIRTLTMCSAIITEWARKRFALQQAGVNAGQRFMFYDWDFNKGWDKASHEWDILDELELADLVRFTKEE